MLVTDLHARITLLDKGNKVIFTPWRRPKMAKGSPKQRFPQDASPSSEKSVRLYRLINRNSVISFGVAKFEVRKTYCDNLA